MNTLLELLTFTKGTEYLIAIGLLFAFIALWQWQQHRGRGLIVRVVPLAAVALAFGVLASTCVSPSAVATTPPEEWPSVDSAHYLANIYGPAKFAAHDMGPDIVSCQTCHHHSPDGEPRPCKDCHSEPFDDANPGKPGLKAAYHQACVSCHKEALEGPMTCTRCHTETTQSAEFKKQSPSPVTPPSISHSLLDRYHNCLVCHNPEGQLPLPGNHAGYNANVVCLGCHKPSVQSEALSLISAIFPAPTAPTSGTAAEGKPTPALATPTMSAASPMPSGAAATAEPTKAAAPEPEPTTAPAPPQAPMASKITHPVAGRENCTMCHKAGASAPLGMPADHANRGNDNCQMCHKP